MERFWTYHTGTWKSVPAESNAIAIFDFAPLVFESFVVHDNLNPQQDLKKRWNLGECAVFQHIKLQITGLATYHITHQLVLLGLALGHATHYLPVELR